MARRKFFPSYNVQLLIALLLGVATGWLQMPALVQGATAVGDVIINLLKLVSLPMIFLSVVSTISGMHSFGEVRTLGKRTLIYTVALTFAAALLGLALFLLINPAQTAPAVAGTVGAPPDGAYLSFLLNIFPSNAVQVFLENHVIGVMLIALVLGLAILSLPSEQKKPLHAFFSAFFAAVLKVTHWLVYLMPLGVWAFVAMFTDNCVHESPEKLRNFLLYIVCILSANLLHGLVILPLFLKFKGISPWRLAKGALPALTLGFFTRSSNAALPVTLQCSQERIGHSKRVSNFTLPLCSTINMNGCAAFITITVLYVATSAGMSFSVIDYLMWAAIATLAAIGNAGVAMGCYFLSSALLAAMNVPLTLLGMILPLYVFIDMVETALNIWSDFCITSTVDKELGESEPVAGVLETQI
jgi:Na+/H+-dicarboxylate symporter